MPFNATDVNQSLSASDQATANLTIACQGILKTSLTPSDSTWYRALQGELDQAQTLAQQWQAQLSTQLKEEVLTAVIDSGKEFTTQELEINHFFAQASDDFQGNQMRLQIKLMELKSLVLNISRSVADYAQTLSNWGQALRQTHQQMSETINQIQAQEAALQGQIAAINSQLADLQSQIAADRSAIEQAKREETKAILENVLEVFSGPLGGLATILGGMGVSSIAEAERKVATLEQTIQNYQDRIAFGQGNLTQDQAQLVALNALTLSAGIAVSDLDIAEQMLNVVRISWAGLLGEMEGVINKITRAQDFDTLLLERTWFNAACKEWLLIMDEAQRLIGM
ncbi:MAG: hypothetical protein EWV88_15095 [Microcystis wesenbergii Mw_MB_S_20031200_S109D]|uniref:Non-hemolytic enterotoxin lytic component L1 n=1 Tax=Microcystis wesenbergii Mw_MB_S_20031200_S109D TaxID=2486241 RepID=A0A552LMM0_9CHRO|nr:MAG: hypothetical protein EWV88_15095 [Microcystis wesenbergii Mw_MB_S_20031200_S109D]